MTTNMCDGDLWHVTDMVALLQAKGERVPQPMLDKSAEAERLRPKARIGNLEDDDLEDDDNWGLFFGCREGTLGFFLLVKGIIFVKSKKKTNVDSVENFSPFSKAYTSTCFELNNFDEPIKLKFDVKYSIVE